MLKPESTLEQALAELARNGLGFVCVFDDQLGFIGGLTIADITRALVVIASTPAECRRDASKVQVRELLSPDPVTISSDDSSLLAASTMLEHGLNWIPVVVNKTDRHLKGFVRAEKLSYWMLQELGKQTLIRAQAAT
jgi:CBS domain-containing protein